MSIVLEKRAEKVRIILEKKSLPSVPPMRVGLALDVSGSARPLYENGTIQQTVERLLAVAMRFDDNGEMDMWAFHNYSQGLIAANPGNFEGYVQREILGGSLSLWGGTDYAPILGDMVDFWFSDEARAGKKPGLLASLFGKKQPVSAPTPDSPALALFITDGANSDRAAARRMLMESQHRPIYWQMVGVGNPSEFGFLREMADALPNVGFVHLSDLSIGDDALYGQLLSDELATWVKARQ